MKSQHKILSIIKHTSMVFALLFVFAGIANAKKFNAKVKDVRGKVFYQLPGSEEQRVLKKGMRLKEGTRVVTSENGNALIFVVPGAAIQVVENTDFTLGTMSFESENGVTLERTGRIHLQDGTVSTLIKENEADVTDFQIITPQGSAAARGTFYGVTVKDGKMFTKVIEGHVSYHKQQRK